MINFIVQARSGSSRMPNKILLPFYNDNCILELLIKKLKTVQNANVIIATSTNTNCDQIESIAKKYSVICFRGSEDDVLQRFIDAARNNNADKIVRVCSDNPFLELKSIHQLIDYVNSSKDILDYVSFDINGFPSIKTHYGFWTEYTTLNTLIKINSLTKDKLYHEHVTNFIYSHPNLFCIKWIKVPECLAKQTNIRLTIDTEEDFKIAQRIYNDLCSDNPYPTIDEIITFLDSHQDLYQKMKQQISNNSK